MVDWKTNHNQFIKKRSHFFVTLAPVEKHMIVAGSCLLLWPAIKAQYETELDDFQCTGLKFENLFV